MPIDATDPVTVQPAAAPVTYDKLKLSFVQIRLDEKSGKYSGNANLRRCAVDAKTGAVTFMPRADDGSGQVNVDTQDLNAYAARSPVVLAGLGALEDAVKEIMLLKAADAAQL